MAWYCETKMWYRGRLLEINLRYGDYEGGAKVIKGKPLQLMARDDKRIAKLVRRMPARVRMVRQICDAMVADGFMPNWPLFFSGE